MDTHSHWAADGLGRNYRFLMAAPVFAIGDVVRRIRSYRLTSVGRVITIFIDIDGNTKLLIQWQRSVRVVWPGQVKRVRNETE